MPLCPETQKKIRRVEMYTRRLLRGSLVGSSRSALKGVGFEFDQIREYMVGDDLRFVDWHASARSQTVLVKEYIEERSRNIMLVIDGSRSMFFGTTDKSKYDRVAWIAAVLSFIGLYGSDNVGCILYTDEIEYFLPYGKGQTHIHHLMQRLFEYVPTKTKTDSSVAFKKLLQKSKKKSLVFVISDFIDTHMKSYLAQVARCHDVIAIRCLESYEHAMPQEGFVMMQDLESGDMLQINCGSVDVNGALRERLDEQNSLFKRCGITCLDIKKDDLFIRELLTLFRRRMRY